MSLKSLALPFVLNSSDNNPVQDFFVPALKNSARYDRGVGYFSSGWLRLVAEGLVEFAANAGRMRLIASPVLDDGDWEALAMGSQSTAECRVTCHSAACYYKSCR